MNTKNRPPLADGFLYLNYEAALTYLKLSAFRDLFYPFYAYTFGI
jgi:hypothetical protein